MSKIKGQNFRLAEESFSGCFPEATNCTIGISTKLLSRRTKDNVGMAAYDVRVSTTWDVQVDTLMSEVSELQQVVALFNGGAATEVEFDQTSGTNNRVIQHTSRHRSGQAFLKDFSMSFNDREMVSSNLQFQGTGMLARWIYVCDVDGNRLVTSDGEYIMIKSTNSTDMADYHLTQTGAEVQQLLNKIADVEFATESDVEEAFGETTTSV